METKNLIEIQARDLKVGDIIHIAPWYQIPVCSEPYLNDYGAPMIKCDFKDEYVFNISPIDQYFTVERKLNEND